MTLTTHDTGGIIGRRKVFKMVKLGKTLILGDSYSTFKGHIPEGYISYYAPVYSEADKGCTDVTRVEETWWHQLIQETDSELILNSSFSGSTICNTGYNGDDFSDRSFVSRFDELAESGFFDKNNIETLLVMGGTNDSWANSPIGELKYENWTREDLYLALPAFGYLLSRIREKLPEARVIFIINLDLKEELVKNYKIACEKYGVEVIELTERHCLQNSGHPSVQGMKDIKNKVLAHL